MDDYTSSTDNAQQNGIGVEEQHKVIVDFLTNNNEMKKAAKHSIKHGLMAGAGAIAGGLLLGPIGGLVGGVAGSIVGYTQSENYDGAIQQLINLESTRKAQLVDAVRVSLVDAGASAPKAFASIDAFKATLSEYTTNRAVRDQIWTACMNAIHDT